MLSLNIKQYITNKPPADFFYLEMFPFSSVLDLKLKNTTTCTFKASAHVQV